MSELRYCEIQSCILSHIENCPECFGFGFISWVEKRRLPASASKFLTGEHHILKCDICGGGGVILKSQYANMYSVEFIEKHYREGTLEKLFEGKRGKAPERSFSI